MKGLCISTNENQSTFNVVLSVGRYYEIEDIASGTGAQNRAFHSLMTEYHRSGLHSYSSNVKIFREEIKKYLGAGFESYIYANIENGKPKINKVNTYEEVPEGVRHDPDLKKMVMGKLKSWGDYTKKERRETIDRLISEMRQAGVSSKKFDEIIKGMEVKNAN